ncbi:MAG: SUMF1/EgtB/PvdO family nonheme iron enzyme [Chloroflexota bacterium]
MATPDSQEDQGGIWRELLQAAEGLPAPLRFVIVFGVLVVIGLVVSGATISPGLLPLIYGLFVVGAGLYVWWEWLQFRERAAERQHELDRLKLEGQMVERTTVLPTPTPERQPAATPPTEATWRQRYLDELATDCAHLSMASIDPRARQSDAARLALQSIFTELDVARRPEEEELRGGKKARPEEPEEKEERQPALAAISRHGRLVLLGKPGSGKSTLVNFVALCLAGEGLGWGGGLARSGDRPQPEEPVNLSRLAGQGWTLPALLPVRVILRDYAARGLPAGQGLWAFIVAELESVTCEEGTLAGFAPFLKPHLEKQGGLLLLDGLDEVPEAHQRRRQLRQAIQGFARDFPRVRIVVTSRPYAYDDPEWQLPGFDRAELLDFSPEQIKTYVGRWYTATGRQDRELGPTRAGQYAEQLKREVERNPSLAELAPRPLLLALMVSLHRWRGGGALPQEREKLYDQSVELLLDLWQRPKQLYDAQGRPLREETSALAELGISTADLRDALSTVAFQAHRDQPNRVGTADVAGSALAAALFDAPSRRPDVSEKRIIQYVEERAGLLEERGLDRQGHRIYAFPHRTFQEYLAACYLLKRDTFPEEMVELATHQPERWREAVLLAANRQLERSPALVWDLIDALCLLAWPMADQTFAEPEGWGAALAGELLVETGLYENPSARHTEKLERVRTWQRVLLTSGALTPRARATAGVSLACLNDPRREVTTVEAMRFCYVPAGPFWMGSDGEEADEQPCHLVNLEYDYWLGLYPVTNAQFQVFVDERGYHEPAYWPEAQAAGYWQPKKFTGFQGRWDGAPRQQPADYGRPFNLPNHPVVGVTWYESLAFSRWLTRQWQEERLLPAGWSVTLPSEAEWEKAARGGVEIPAEPIERAILSRQVGTSFRPPMQPNPDPRRVYPWLGQDDPNKANGQESGIGTTSAVGGFPAGASPYGCLEMSGNVWEWTRSLDQSYPYAPGDGREKLAAGPDALRVFRGGACYSNSSRRRCSCRSGYSPDYHLRDYGLRVAVSPFLHL